MILAYQHNGQNKLISNPNMVVERAQNYLLVQLCQNAATSKQTQALARQNKREMIIVTRVSLSRYWATHIVHNVLSSPV